MTVPSREWPTSAKAPAGRLALLSNGEPNSEGHSQEWLCYATQDAGIPGEVHRDAEIAKCQRYMKHSR